MSSPILLGSPHSVTLDASFVKQLAVAGPSELLTFDVGQQRQAAVVASSVIVTLLTP